MELLIHLIKAVSVFLCIGYLFCKSPWFKPLTTDSLRVRDKIYLYFFFSAISIMGTYFGWPVHDAIANTRAVGAILAGLIGGPILGTAVGFTSGLHRFLLGGFSAFSCGLGTTLEGTIGGLVHLYLIRSHRSELIFDPLIALVAAFVGEVVHMAITPVFSRPYAEAVELVKTVVIPMTVSSSIGTALFISIIRDQKNMLDRVAVVSSGKAFQIAQKSLNILSRGIDKQTAPDLARIIYEETKVGAVAITDREKVLAFIGYGSDHHLPGSLIASPMTKEAMEENKVIFLDGIRDQYTCPLSEWCPLNSVLVVPLRIDDEVIGTIKLYEPGDKRFLNINKSLGEGITNLLSDQLLIARYQKQKNLLLRAELKLLQAQVNPHFLFNSLNTVISILRNDAVRARDLLLHLSTFLRSNLKQVNDLSTLEEELDQVKSYLKIEKARFEERLTIEINVDPNLLKQKLPALTLQPLVENAIKHGISNMLQGGTVRINAYPLNGSACIEIEDNAGAFQGEIGNGGLGIKIVDKRIKALFGSDFGTHVSCVPNELTKVTINVPMETA